MKLPKLPGEDTVTRQKASEPKSHNVWIQLMEENLNRIPSEQAVFRAKEKVCRGIKDMNLGTGPSSSGELNVNDSMVVEKEIVSSSEEIMGDNSVVEKGTASSLMEE
ncbi:hypothetical protein OROHE_007526 [Orobanche hederae]